MAGINKKPLGSFARRLEYIQRKLLLEQSSEFSQIKFLPEIGYKKIEESYFNFQIIELKQESQRLKTGIAQLKEKSSVYMTNDNNDINQAQFTETEIFKQRLEVKDTQIETAVQKIEKMKVYNNELKKEIKTLKTTTNNLSGLFFQGINQEEKFKSEARLPDFDELELKYNEIRNNSKDNKTNKRRCTIM